MAVYRKVKVEKEIKQGKTINLGRKSDTQSAMPEISPKKKISYPSFYIDNIQLPIKPEDVGKEIQATVSLELKGIRENTSKAETNFNYEFDIKTIQFKE